ncbi:MAG: hypothetical protein EPN40_13870 [Rhodanobacteraceae bacterium]|nr:MAG: hypothetical protein EPN40_13870 [Rhodanobacteraceae bacterium]
MADRPPFFAELKRRNVVRAAVLYAGAVWALAQGISQLSGPFGLADWVTRWFVIVCAIGFPFWIAFAWYYEITPHGIKRESDVTPGESIMHSTARKLDLAIIGVLIVAVVLLASGYFIRRNAPAMKVAPTAPAEATTAAAPAAFAPPGDSLVVLPFTNLNGDPKQQYFSDGITEELTDALSQIPELRVIAWETASKLRDSVQSTHAIGQSLNVANLLHGSIERDGDQVRITAELVDTRTGLQLWSQHYDDAFADIFKVQDQVSEAIAGALKVKFAQVDLPQGGTTRPEAHDLVLRGRELERSGNAASLAAARKDFEKAIALDPEYADAHALLSRTLLRMTENANLLLGPTLPGIRAEAEKALGLDPRNADAWVALGNADSNAAPPDFAKARVDYRRALALDPSNAAAHTDYGTVLPLKQALAEDREAALLDPADETAWNNLSVDAQDLGDWAQMVQASESLIKLDPKAVDSTFALAYAYQQLHQYDRMVAAFDLVKPSTPLDQEQIDTGRLTYRAIGDPALRPQALAALEALALHQSNQDVASNLWQMYLALGDTAPALKLLENSCPAYPIGCNDLAVNPMYTALRADPRFQKLVKKYNTMTVQ